MVTDKPARPRSPVLRRQWGRRVAAGRERIEKQSELCCDAGPDPSNTGSGCADMHTERLVRPRSQALSVFLGRTLGAEFSLAGRAAPAEAHPVEGHPSPKPVKLALTRPLCRQGAWLSSLIGGSLMGARAAQPGEPGRQRGRQRAQLCSFIQLQGLMVWWPLVS